MRLADGSGNNLTCRFSTVTPESAQRQAGADPPKHEPKTFDEALHPLTGVCIMRNEGWWTYRWCHRTEVRQVAEAGVEHCALRVSMLFA